MNDIYPAFTGPAAGYRLDALLPGWLGFTAVPGVLLDSAVTANGYWARYEQAAGLFDAANDDVVAATGGWSRTVLATGVFSPQVTAIAQQVSWETASGRLTLNVPVGGVFGSDIVTTGLLEVD